MRSLSGIPSGEAFGSPDVTQGGASGPVISALSFVSQGDTLGGEFFIIAGTGFTGATAVKIDGVNVRAYVVDTDGQIRAIAPPGSAGTKDVVVTTPAGDSTGGEGLWEYWDPTVEASCTTFVERGYYNEEISGGGDWGLNWTARKGTSHFTNKYTDFLRCAKDDEGIEPRCVSGETRFLANSVDGFNTLCTGVNTTAQLQVTFAMGFRTPNAPAHATHAYQDTEPLLCDAGGGVSFATSMSDNGFGCSFFDGAWQDRYGVCNADEQNVGIVRIDSTGAGNLDVRANGGSWDTTALSAAYHVDLSMYMGLDYSATNYADERVRFMMFAGSVWSDGLCAKLDTWAKNRHGGKTDVGGGVAEIWYVTSDVLPVKGATTPPKQITIKGKGFTGAGAVYISLSTYILACTSVVVVDDNTITCVPPDYGVEGKATLIVTGGGKFVQMVDAVEYYDVFGRAAEIRMRVGDDATRTDDGTNVSALTNSGVADGGTRDWQGNGTAGHLFSTGDDPFYYVADADFGGEDSAGMNDGTGATTGRAFVTPNAYTTHVPSPATVYTVLWVGTYFTDNFWVLSQPGSSTNAFSSYGVTGASAFTIDNGGASFPVSMPDSTPSVLSAVYNGADSSASVNNWMQFKHGSTAGGSDQETSLGFGDFGTTHPVPWKLACRIVIAGIDNYSTRRKTIRSLENFYQLPAVAA